MVVEVKLHRGKEFDYGHSYSDGRSGERLPTLGGDAGNITSTGTKSCWYPGRQRREQKFSTSTTARTISVDQQHQQQHNNARGHIGGRTHRNQNQQQQKTMGAAAVSTTCGSRPGISSKNNHNSGSTGAAASMNNDNTNNYVAVSNLSVDYITTENASMSTSSTGLTSSLSTSYAGKSIMNKKQRQTTGRQRSPKSIIPEEGEGEGGEEDWIYERNGESSTASSSGIVRQTDNTVAVVRDSPAVAAVETNCMQRQFWTDEMVDGGAFSCFEGIARRTRCLPETTSGSAAADDAAVVSATLIPEEFVDKNADDDAATFNSIIDGKGEFDDDNLTLIDEHTGPPTISASCNDQLWQDAVRNAICAEASALTLGRPVPTSPGPRQLDGEEEHGLDGESLVQLEIVPQDDPLWKKQLHINNGRGQVQYIPEEPLDIAEEKSALRRGMCTKVRLRKQKQNQKQHQTHFVGTPGKATKAPENVLAPSKPSTQEESEQQHQSNNCSVADLSSAANCTPEKSQQPSSLTAPWKDCASSNGVDSNQWIQGGLLASGLVKSQPRNQLELRRPPLSKEEEEALNFYVEVEAMKEQLDGIRDLDEIEQAEAKKSDGEVGRARSASLVDEDSTFMESVDSRKNGQSKIIKQQNDKRRGLRLPMCGGGSTDDRAVRISYTSNAPNEQPRPIGQSPTHPNLNFAVRGRKTTPYDYLKSHSSSKSGDEVKGGEDNVSAPVPLTRSISQQIAMRALELAGLKQDRGGTTSTTSRPGGHSQMDVLNEVTETDDRDQMPSTTTGEASLMPFGRSGMDTSMNRDALNRSNEMSIESASSQRHQDQSMTSVSPSRESTQRSNASPNDIPARWIIDDVNDDSSERLKSGIGYNKTETKQQMINQSWSADDLAIPQSPILAQSFESGGAKGLVRQNNGNNFPSETFGSPGAAKFDDNFWQEDDASGLDTNAFEEFDNEQDSLFDDLRSTSNVSSPDISSKNSTASDRSAGNFRDYTDPNNFDVHGNTISPEPELPKFRDFVPDFSTGRSHTGRSRNVDNSMLYSTTERTERSAVSNTSAASPFSFREEELGDFETHMSF